MAAVKPTENRSFKRWWVSVYLKPQQADPLQGQLDKDEAVVWQENLLNVLRDLPQKQGGH